jgi:hypothetical protein
VFSLGVSRQASALFALLSIWFGLEHISPRLYSSRFSLTRSKPLFQINSTTLPESPSITFSYINSISRLP